MKTKIVFRTEAGAARLRRFFTSQHCPAPQVSRYFAPISISWNAYLESIHLQQLRALMIGWKNLRAAKAELKGAAV